MGPLPACAARSSADRSLAASCWCCRGRPTWARGQTVFDRRDAHGPWRGATPAITAAMGSSRSWVQAWCGGHHADLRLHLQSQRPPVRPGWMERQHPPSPWPFSIPGGRALHRMHFVGACGVSPTCARLAANASAPLLTAAWPRSSIGAGPGARGNGARAPSSCCAHPTPLLNPFQRLKPHFLHLRAARARATRVLRAVGRPTTPAGAGSAPLPPADTRVPSSPPLAIAARRDHAVRGRSAIGALAGAPRRSPALHSGP
jgi:hypothetical protein